MSAGATGPRPHVAASPLAGRSLPRGSILKLRLADATSSITAFYLPSKEAVHGLPVKAVAYVDFVYRTITLVGNCATGNRKGDRGHLRAGEEVSSPDLRIRQ